MKKAKKVAVLLLAAVMVMTLPLNAYAESFNSTDFLYTGPATAGAWKTEATHPLSYSTNVYSHLCGGDMGVWFYSNSVGLQSSFVKESGRTVEIELWEGTGIFHSLADRYIGYFETDANGNYRPTYYTNPYVNSGNLNSAGLVKLYIKFNVHRLSGDTSTAVNTNLLYYRKWCKYD